MIYLKSILSKHDDEVVPKVYFAMKNSPLKGDWYNLIESDFANIRMVIDENAIKEADLISYKKKHIKKSVWNVFFNQLQERK